MIAALGPVEEIVSKDNPLKCSSSLEKNETDTAETGSQALTLGISPVGQPLDFQTAQRHF